MSNEFEIGTEPDLDLLGDPGNGPDDNDEDYDDEENENPASEDAAGDESDSEEPVDEEAPKQARRDPVIPRARFDEVNAKLHQERQARERLEAELADIRASSASQEAKAIDVDLRVLKRQAFELRMTDEEEADRIEELIEAERDRRAEVKALAAVERREAAREQLATHNALQAAQAEIISEHPWLDHTTSHGDQRAIAEVVALRDTYISGGMPPVDALIEAANMIARARGSSIKQQDAEDPTAPVDKRKRAAVATAARVSATQPPRVDAGVGNRAIPAGNSIVGNQDRWERASETERLRYLQ